MKKIIAILIPILLIIIVTGSTCLLMYINDFRMVHVNGHSMYPTLIEQDYVISIKKNKYKNGDIIMFEHVGTKYIKRIVGIPGDTISITENGVVSVNNIEIKEDYIHKHTDSFRNEQTYPITIKENEYFVLGDNRDDSLDSRIISFGTINKDEIIGKIVYRIDPFTKFK